MKKEMNMKDRSIFGISNSRANLYKIKISSKNTLNKSFEKRIKKMSCRTCCGIFVLHLIDYQQVIVVVHVDSLNQRRLTVFQSSLSKIANRMEEL